MKKYEVVIRHAVDFYYVVEAGNEDDAVALADNSGLDAALCKHYVDFIVPSVREVDASNRHSYDALKDTEVGEVADWLDGIDPLNAE
jgi:hypothetical protein